MNDTGRKAHRTDTSGARRYWGQPPARTAGPVRDGGAIGRRRRAAQSAGSPEYQSKRREVIHAAASVFAVKGYQATNLDDIATALQTNRASLYYYVSGKEELLREVIAEYAPGFVEEARRIADSRQTAAQKLQTFVNWIMKSYESDYPNRYLLLLRNDAPGDDSQWTDQIDKIGQEVQAHLIDILRRGIDSGELRANLQIDLVANALFGFLTWADHWFTPGPSHTVDGIAETLVELLLDGLAVPNQCALTTICPQPRSL